MATTSPSYNIKVEDDSTFYSLHSLFDFLMALSFAIDDLDKLIYLTNQCIQNIGIENVTHENGYDNLEVLLCCCSCKIIPFD